MTIYLVRHAEYAPIGAGSGVYEKDAEATLSRHGLIEARALAAKLKRLGVDRVFYSPFRRTRETAEIVSRILGVPMECVEDLREHKIVSDVQECKIWKETREAIRRDHDHAPHGSESLNQAAARIRAVVDRIATSDAKRPVLISHALVLQALLMKTFSLEKPPQIDTASITAIRKQDGGYVLVHLNHGSRSVGVFVSKARRTLIRLFNRSGS